jgi:hypothetical protein
MEDEIPQPAKTSSRKKGGGLTPLERERRIDYAAEVLLRFHRRSDQIDAMCSKFGIQWRQATQYFQYARERILEASKKSREDHIADSIEFYESICRNPLEKTSDRLQARKQLERALDIGMTKVSVTVPDSPLVSIDLAAIAAKARAERKSKQEPEPEKVVTE